MADTLYPSYATLMMTNAAGLFDLVAEADIRNILIDEGLYTYSTAHDFLNDIPTGAARVSTSGNMTGRTVTAGVFDADDTVHTAVTGNTIEAVVIYRHTGVETTSDLICRLNTSGLFPITPSGIDITIRWAAAAPNIFALV